MKFALLGKGSRKEQKLAVSTVIASLPSDCVIITIDTKGGFEAMVREEAVKKSIMVKSFVKYRPPEGSWPREYERATSSRNKKVISESDMMYVFSDEDEISDLAEEARQAGIPVENVLTKK